MLAAVVIVLSIQTMEVVVVDPTSPHLAVEIVGSTTRRKHSEGDLMGREKIQIRLTDLLTLSPMRKNVFQFVLIVFGKLQKNLCPPNFITSLCRPTDSFTVV